MMQLASASYCVLESTHRLTESVYKVLGLRPTTFSVDISLFLTSDAASIALAMLQSQLLFSS